MIGFVLCGDCWTVLGQKESIDIEGMSPNSAIITLTEHLSIQAQKKEHYACKSGIKKTIGFACLSWNLLVSLKKLSILLIGSHVPFKNVNHWSK